MNLDTEINLKNVAHSLTFEVIGYSHICLVMTNIQSIMDRLNILKYITWPLSYLNLASNVFTRIKDHVQMEVTEVCMVIYKRMVFSIDLTLLKQLNSAQQLAELNSIKLAQVT